MKMKSTNILTTPNLNTFGKIKPSLGFSGSAKSFDFCPNLTVGKRLSAPKAEGGTKSSCFTYGKTTVYVTIGPGYGDREKGIDFISFNNEGR